MDLNHFTLASLAIMNTETELTYDTIDDAMKHAEDLTELDFEVSVPISLDGGLTYTFVVSS